MYLMLICISDYVYFVITTSDSSTVLDDIRKDVVLDENRDVGVFNINTFTQGRSGDYQTAVIRDFLLFGDTVVCPFTLADDLVGFSTGGSER